MTAKELYKKAIFVVKCIQISWVISMCASLTLAILFLPWWAMLIIPIAGIAVYHFMIIMLGMYFASIAELDQLKECRNMLSSDMHTIGDQEPNPLELGDIVAIGTHIGNIGDRKIYDWIDVQYSGKLQRFTFDRGAKLQNDEYVDVSNIAEDEACYQGVIYKKITT